MTASKITALTAKQQARLPEFRKYWFDVGTDCQPVDREQTKAVITDFYKRLGKPAPQFFFFSSPMLCELGLAALKAIMNHDQVGEKIRDQLETKLRDQLETKLRDQIKDQLAGQLWDQLWGQIGDQLKGGMKDRLRDQLKGHLRDQLETKLRDQLETKLRDQIKDQLAGQLWDQLVGQLRGQLWGRIKDQLKNPEFLHTSLWGQQDAYWIAFYKFCNEIGVKYSEDNLDILNAWGVLAESCCWWLALEGVCIVSDRPRKVSFDTDDRLHCENGKAVEFSDGWGVSAWRGTRIPDEWVEDRSNIKPEMALTWENLEQRRVASEIIGWVNVLNQLNAVTLDKDEDPQIGELLEVDLPDVGRERFLKVKCGTGRDFALPVPPDMQTALQANAWTYGMDASEYKPEVRT